uniref:EGF-like domain-containing protein n=1 Tax=Angiostrongylus costaricensis TaxID=334426 RepID=A0A0R3PEB0_ANGCS
LACGFGYQSGIVAFIINTIRCQYSKFLLESCNTEFSRCENGGMCAFSFENPQLHSCICLMGVYEGDRCQFQGHLYISFLPIFYFLNDPMLFNVEFLVGVPRDSPDFFRQSQHETTPSQRRSPPPAPTQGKDVTGFCAFI